MISTIILAFILIFVAIISSNLSWLRSEQRKHNKKVEEELKALKEYLKDNDELLGILIKESRKSNNGTDTVPN